MTCCKNGLFNGKSRNNFCDMYMYVMCCDVQFCYCRHVKIFTSYLNLNICENI